MALLNWGSEKRAGISFDAKAKWQFQHYKKEISLPKITNLGTLGALSFKLKLPSIGFLEAENPWDLRIRSLVLGKESRCFYPELFNMEKNIVVLGFSWSYNGHCPKMFPDPEKINQWAFVDLATGNTRKLQDDNLQLYANEMPAGQLGTMIFVVELPRNAEHAKAILKIVQKTMEQSEFCESVKSFPMNLSASFAQKLEMQRQMFINELKKLFFIKKLDILEIFKGFFSTAEVQENLTLTYNKDFLQFEIELITKANPE